MSFLESDDGPFERRSRFNQPDNVSRLTTVSSYVPKKQKMTMPNRASFLQERGSVRSGVSSADSISETGYDGDDKALDGKSAKGSKAFRTLPQYYRGNHGEVSPIRVRPLYMTRYSFRDTPVAGDLDDAATAASATAATGSHDIFDETGDVQEGEEAPIDDVKENLPRRVSMPDKSLYSHVLHRVKNFGGEDRRKSSLRGVPQEQQKQQPVKPSLHLCDEDQLSIWLEKIRRRKAYRSPFSALLPGCGASNSSSSTSMESTGRGSKSDDDDDDDDDDDEANHDIGKATPSYYVDASSSTPSRILNYILSGSSPSGPFRSPDSVIRGGGGECERDGRGAEVLSERKVWMKNLDI